MLSCLCSPSEMHRLQVVSLMLATIYLNKKQWMKWNKEQEKQKLIHCPSHRMMQSYVFKTGVSLISHSWVYELKAIVTQQSVSQSKPTVNNKTGLSQADAFTLFQPFNSSR